MNHVVSFGLIAVVCSLGIGCAVPGESERPSEVRADGLSVVALDEAAGALTANFRKDGRTLTFQFLLGPKMLNGPSADDLAADPELPSAETDIRVVDQEGKVFIQQLGGDRLMDASWAPSDGRIHVDTFDPELRAKDLELAREAESAFRALELPPALAQLRLAGIQLAKGLEHAADKRDIAVPSEPLDQPPGATTKGTVSWGPGTTRYWDYEVKYKPTAGQLAQHSAVVLRAWNSSYAVIYYFQSCNHGTCGLNMGVRCTMSGFRYDDGTHSRYFYQELRSDWGVSGGCSTPYTPTSGLYWQDGDYGHNCHDDTVLQAYNIYYDAVYSTTAGTCGDTGAMFYAPTGSNGAVGCW